MSWATDKTTKKHNFYRATANEHKAHVKGPFIQRIRRGAVNLFLVYLVKLGTWKTKKKKKKILKED